ncbi:MAG: SRPBCC family protein [Actinomycetota bacterium]
MTEIVTRTIEVPVGPEVVWQALTDADELRRWFGADVRLEAVPGGAVRAVWPDGGRSIGSVEAADEPRRLVFRWRRIGGVGFASEVGGASRVTFELETAAGGTTVSVTEEPVELASVVAGP